jgi:ATP-dependent helicase IRC3
MASLQASGAADITVASVRSLLSSDRLSKYIPARFKLVLVDEAHHIVAPGYLEILEHFGLYPEEKAPQSTPALVGVSATFSRFDGLRLGAAIDHIVYHKDYVDMIGDKWLSDVMFTTVKSHANLSKVKTGKDGDFLTGSLSEAVNTEETNEITYQSWLSEARDRKSTLVFCVDLKHVRTLTATFRKHGVDARYITGSTRKKERGERLDAFKRREFPVLINCSVFTEGTDMPNIDCVLLARPTKSRNLLVQMIGRGMRLYAGKQNCHVIDMVASLETGIVTVPTLFGLDPSEIVEAATSTDLRTLKEKRDQEVPIQASSPFSPNPDLSNTTINFTQYDTIHDLIGDTSGERHVRATSPNAWIQLDNHKYVLVAKGGILTLERRHPTQLTPDIAFELDDDNEPLDLPHETPSKPEEPLYHVIWKYPLPPSAQSKSPLSRPRTVATASTFTAALHAADTFAATKFERLFINTSSSWRKQPASQGQIDFLNKLRSVDAANEGEGLLTPDDLSKGQAGDMITKIKYGARGRWKGMMVERRKVERKMAVVRRLRERESVRVGPLDA